MDPTTFLSADEFAALIAPRVLLPGERALVELLVQAAAAWIRHPDRRPGLTASDPLAVQAKLVTYDVVSAVLGAAGVDPRVRQITTSTDNRQTSITYADAAGLLEFDDRHLVMLDLSTTAVPQARFDDFDTAFDDCGPRRW
ncbi:head-tail connector [Mycobacterium phage Weirdo19]|uniref:Head-tail connector n=1 Tax=Mycobacterium phage Weirdo19 TaxID=2601610 RepID=A0A6M2YSQ5_9CAUD|nr:head-tail connector [Mycobacterium phage Weirdo19]QEA10776.1 head-tail connector [Mycobacterium phage Weirdo19]